MDDKDRLEKDEPQVKAKKSTALLQIPEAWQGLDDRVKHDPSPTLSTHNEATKHISKHSDVSNISEFPMRDTASAAAKSDSAPRKGFLGFFGRKKEEKAKSPMELGRKNALLTFPHLADIAFSQLQFFVYPVQLRPQPRANRIEQPRLST